MYEVLACGYEVICQLIPFLIVLRYLIKWNSRSGLITITFFALYVIAVFHVTGVGTLYDLLRFQPQFLPGRINLIPFSRDINWTGYLLNVLMFVPLGIFLPVLWRNFTGYFNVLFSSLGLSFLIEVSQIFCLRGCDVDDLIMNTAGSMIGLIFYHVISRFIKEKCLYQYKSSWEFAVIVLTLYFGRFFLFNQLGFINLYYGF